LYVTTVGAVYCCQAASALLVQCICCLLHLLVYKWWNHAENNIWKVFVCFIPIYTAH